jgi:MerR family transcriptional regulator, light-induced transcriptional regulator
MALPTDNLNLHASRTIDAQSADLAERMTQKQYEARPELATRYGPAGRARCYRDAMHHLASLSAAVKLSAPELFVDYIAWAKVMLEARNIPASDLALNLACMREALLEGLPNDASGLAAQYVEASMEQLRRTGEPGPSGSA